MICEKCKQEGVFYYELRWSYEPPYDDMHVICRKCNSEWRQSETAHKIAWPDRPDRREIGHKAWLMWIRGELP